MSVRTAACETVGHGAVGEAGNVASVTRQLGSRPPSKLMIVKNVGTDLCGDHGAWAVLTVNGNPVAIGDITASGASIQTEAAPGDTVVGIVHTVPLNNGIVCVRLGNLKFELLECDIVRDDAPATGGGGGVVEDPCISTRDWYAWNNLMPPKPDDFHVVGEVLVNDPMVSVSLVPKIPQGINPNILLLDILLIQLPLSQLPGTIKGGPTWKPVRYDRVNVTYTQVQIFHGGCLVADLAVDNIH